MSDGKPAARRAHEPAAETMRALRPCGLVRAIGPRRPSNAGGGIRRAAPGCARSRVARTTPACARQTSRGCRAPARMARGRSTRSGMVRPATHAGGTSAVRTRGIRQRHRIEGVDRGCRFLTVEQLAAAVPRLLHLVALGEQPLQVQHGQVFGPNPGRGAFDRHAVFVQRQPARAAVVHPAIVEQRNLLPVGCVVPAFAAIPIGPAPQVVVQALDHRSRLEGAALRVDEPRRQRRRHQLVGVGAPQQIAALVAAGRVEQQPSRLFAHQPLGRFEQRRPWENAGRSRAIRPRNPDR